LAGTEFVFSTASNCGRFLPDASATS